ncbi:hypothetical protein BO94DRAFT_220452 [Aspergillus sclerotioniger CBS 115572]|uniref:Secreted protein n=1 Tax=Aspergillus sclerotioniger CBS 115572 TaxID=1450535 RepID=A0A317XE29_9EURO|nr:hypothetical protein BO94DRAFT_220452 [Aspergillus sclerotioniger CBS 115572]PWY95178.1 hypothetical protein BO94DRAFT_220452 [Aspergillus sclerotioniger CBS 115572]
MPMTIILHTHIRLLLVQSLSCICVNFQPPQSWLAAGAHALNSHVASLVDRRVLCSPLKLLAPDHPANLSFALFLLRPCGVCYTPYSDSGEVQVS